MCLEGLGPHGSRRSWISRLPFSNHELLIRAVLRTGPCVSRRLRIISLAFLVKDSEIPQQQMIVSLAEDGARLRDMRKYTDVRLVVTFRHRYVDEEVLVHTYMGSTSFTLVYVMLCWSSCL